MMMPASPRDIPKKSAAAYLQDSRDVVNSVVKALCLDGDQRSSANTPEEHVPGKSQTTHEVGVQTEGALFASSYGPSGTGNQGKDEEEEDPPQSSVQCVGPVVHPADRVCGAVDPTQLHAFRSLVGPIVEVNTLVGLQKALLKVNDGLSVSNTLALDMEAAVMNRTGKGVGTIQLCFSGNGPVFFIHLPAIAADAAKTHGTAMNVFRIHPDGLPQCSLQHFLESTTIVQLMFDPRGDADALFKFHGVHIGNPFDLQVMDIAIRSCSAGSPTRPLCPTRCRSCTDTIASYLFAAPGAKPTLGVFRALQAIGKKVFEAQDAWVWHRDVIPEPLVLYAVSDVKFLHDLSFAMRRRLKQMANEHLTHYDNQVKLVSKERVALATIAPTHTTALAMRNHPDLINIIDSRARQRAPELKPPLVKSTSRPSPRMVAQAIVHGSNAGNMPFRPPPGLCPPPSILGHWNPVPMHTPMPATTMPSPTHASRTSRNPYLHVASRMWNPYANFVPSSGGGARII